MSGDKVYAADHSDAVLKTHSWRTAANSAAYLIPSLEPTMTILDVGSGPGTISTSLAKLVPSGHVTGVDYSSGPLAAARAHASAEDVHNIDFRVGDINALPFEDASFDVVHAHQVLQHVADPVGALREMRRVAKPGGLVASRESASLNWYPPSPGLQAYHDYQSRMAKARGGHPHPGMRIHVWAREAGFEYSDIVRSTGSWCFSTPEEREYWGGTFATRVTTSSVAKAAVESGFATQEDLERYAQAWRDWVDSEDGWYGLLHGEMLCRV
ncbi:hypothetical protein MBLNU459_g3034t1 [Dothideomycetes sp. NU459]